MKSVQIRSFFWSVFSANTGKYGPEKALYLDTFHTVRVAMDSVNMECKRRWKEKVTSDLFLDLPL